MTLCCETSVTHAPFSKITFFAAWGLRYICKCRPQFIYIHEGGWWILLILRAQRRIALTYSLCKGKQAIRFVVAPFGLSSHFAVRRSTRVFLKIARAVCHTHIHPSTHRHIPVHTSYLVQTEFSKHTYTHTNTPHNLHAHTTKNIVCVRWDGAKNKILKSPNRGSAEVTPILLGSWLPKGSALYRPSLVLHGALTDTFVCLPRISPLQTPPPTPTIWIILHRTHLRIFSCAEDHRPPEHHTYPKFVYLKRIFQLRFINLL